MHRHSAARTPGGDDGHRRVQPEPRSEATSGQQQVLNLQQGVGNSITGQIVQRSPAVIRRAGDKLAFERGHVMQDKDPRVFEIESVIEKHRQAKRAKKDEIEDRREKKIERRDAESKGVKLDIASQKETGLPADLAEFLEEQNEATTIADHKKTLGDYHSEVERDSGWNWEKLAADILKEVGGLALTGTPEDEHVYIRDEESRKILYHVYFGQSRFEKTPDVVRPDRRDNVFTKRGFKPDGKTPSKEFVEDDNKVKTRRFVTRAVTIWHLASMFGLNFKPIENTDEANVEKAIGPDGQRIDAQLPRYNDKKFAGHRDTFRLWQAAAYLGKSGQGGGEFKDNYTTRPEHWDQHYDVMKPGKKTGYEYSTGYNYARERHDEMGLNERASMQVRNGSGPLQPFLSTASIQIDPTGQRKQKIIRANKGERFDTGAENQATVKVDLAEAKKQGIEIVNQHDDESHQHKVAWDRYYDKDDIKALAKRVALAKKYAAHDIYATFAKERIYPTDELKVFDPTDREAIEDGRPQDVFNKKYIKRTAPDELDEYIYSARKNREVLMKKIPISCVTEIKFSEDGEKWEGLDVGDKTKWHPFTQELQAKLKRYLRGSENEDQEEYTNIKKMYKTAAVGKKAEGGTRT